MRYFSQLTTHYFLPHAELHSFEHQLIKLYLITTILAILIFSVLTISLLTRKEKKPIQLDSHIINIFLDLNHYQHHPDQTNLLLSNIVSALQQFIHRHPKLVYWCYIDSQLTHSLDQLHSHIHSTGAVLHLIDTCDQQRFDSNPLLNELLKLISISPPGRHYLISSSDIDLCTAGLQLANNHPNSPILSYVPPHGSPLPDSIPAIPYRFRWEKDDTLSLVDWPKEPVVPSSPTRGEEFEPLTLLLKAHSRSALPLEFVKDYLKPWHTKSSNPEEGTADQQMSQYIDSAVSHGVISLSTLNLKPKGDQSSQTIMVQLQNQLSLSSDLTSSALEHNLNSPTLSERLEPVDDSLTTTGSELETKSRSGQSSPSRLQLDPSDRRSPPQEITLNEDNPPICHQTEEELLIKHKYPSSALDTNPLTDRSPKKKKSQPSSSSPTKNRVGSSSSLKRRSPAKNNQTSVVICSAPIQHSPLESRFSFTGTPTQLEILSKNQDRYSSPIVEFKFRNHDPKEGSLDPLPERGPSHENLRTRSHPETRPSLLTNYSSGLINTSTPLVLLDTFHLSHNTTSEPPLGVDLCERPSINLRPISIRLHRRDPNNQEESALIRQAHLPFKHRLIPAFLRTYSSSVTGLQHDPPACSSDTSSHLDEVD